MQEIDGMPTITSRVVLKQRRAGEGVNFFPFLCFLPESLTSSYMSHHNSRAESHQLKRKEGENCNIPTYTYTCHRRHCLAHASRCTYALGTHHHRLRRFFLSNCDTLRKDLWLPWVGRHGWGDITTFFWVPRDSNMGRYLLVTGGLGQHITC